MPSLTDIAWLVSMVALMALTGGFAIWHTRRIGQGRADPIISPDWTSMERPVSHTDIRWGTLEHSDIDDDHVGRPFPPVTKRSLD